MKWIIKEGLDPRGIKMEIIKEYIEVIEVFGKPRKVTITVKGGPAVVFVEATCALFKGSTVLIKKPADEPYEEVVEYFELIDYAILDYKFDSQKYYDFFYKNRSLEEQE